MKTKIFFIVVMFIAIVSVASAGQNSLIDNIKLGLGLDHNEFIVSNQSDVKFGDKINLTSKYDVTCEWYIDGKLVKMNKDVRESYFIPDVSSIPKQDPMNKVGYKAGRDLKTKKMRYLLELSYNGEKKRWIVEN